MNTTQLIDELISLPLGERARIAEFLLESLSPASPGSHTEAWLATAQRRLDELSDGRAEGVPASEVLDRIRRRYAS